jgi:hypothetical protein
MEHRASVGHLNGHEKFFSAIGRFIYEFSQLEFWLKCIIANTIGLESEHVEPILTHDFAMICTILETLVAPRLSDAQATKLKQLVKTCRSLNDDRVRIAHGFWVMGSEGSGSLHHISRQKLKAAEHFQEAEVIASKADEIQDATRGLVQLMSHVE